MKGYKHMRRKDREITELDKIVDIMRRCDVCRLAFFDEKYPYIVPLNFGLQYHDDKIILYFHGANAGKKLSLIQENNKVCFEMDCSHELVTGENACNYSMNYESVIGFGTIEILSNSEKQTALKAILQQYTSREDLSYNDKMINAVTILKLTVDQVTGKHRI